MRGTVPPVTPKSPPILPALCALFSELPVSLTGLIYNSKLQDELQWLRIGERINFKLCILIHKCLNNCAPRYLAESIRPLSDDPNRSRLRSSKSADVTIPRTRTKMGDRAFLVAGPAPGTIFLDLFRQP